MLSAIIGIPLLVAAVYFGGLYLLTVVAALMFLGAREFSRIVEGMDLRAPVFLLLPGCAILMVFTYFNRQEFPGSAVALVLIIYLLAVVILFPRFTPVDAAVSLMGTFYLGLILYVYLLSTIDRGWLWLIFMLICTWSTDTAAYFVGRKWGKRRLAPVLSPGKTVEGAAGGILGSIAASALIVLIHTELPFIQVMVLGLLVGLAAQAGDLFESAIKRQAGIKDAGRLIPGHGGVLDRFDSMLFTAPLVYYYVERIIIS